MVRHGKAIGFDPFFENVGFEALYTWSSLIYVC
jgi:hypothetical protein